MADKQYLWTEYLDEFSCFTEDVLRKGCHPRKMVHPHPVQDSIVLIHGLSDSPGMMLDLARSYHEEFGYNVYMPLLQCHGLKEPDGMHGVSLNEWKTNIRFALQAASSKTQRVSIAGLSTGGALALYFGSLDRRINHQIHLFSAALGLSGEWFGKLNEILLRSPLGFLYGKIKLKSLVGPNPYRYRLVPINSARELAILIGELAGIRKNARQNYLVERDIFSAWTECDNVVDTSLLANFAEATDVSGYTPFVVSKKYRVQHACVVLQYPIYAGNSRSAGAKPLERANPQYKDMILALGDFVSKTATGSSESV